jgi:hypothetical protein
MAFPKRKKVSLAVLKARASEMCWVVLCRSAVGTLKAELPLAEARWGVQVSPGHQGDQADPAMKYHRQ